MPSTNQSKNIFAPIADVWARFTNFHDLSWASNVITNLEPVGDVAGSEIGAKRILNGAFHETLVEVDNNNHMIKYSIDDGPSPVSKDEVSNYFGVIQLSQTADGTLVEWSSSWDSNGEEAVEFCHGIYVAMLNELADSFQ